jgi:recombination protein RecT
MVVNNEKLKQVLNTATPPQNLQELIEKSAKEFKKVLPEHMRPERLIRIALTCIRQTPALSQCTPESFVGALLVSAQLGLEPMAGRAYILPFFNSKTGKTDAQFLVGYKGLAELFYRHQKAINLSWGIVRANDEFEFEYGTQAKLRHKFGLSNRGDVVAYYVMAELQGGAKPFMVMSKEDCLAHGQKHSKTWVNYKWANGRKEQTEYHFDQSSPWFKEPDAMCLKTVLIQLAKLLPLSVDLQQAIGADETSREYREGIGDALEIPAQPFTEEAPNLETTGQQVKPGIGGITIPQDTAIKALALAVYGTGWDVNLLNRIGNTYGVETLSQLTEKQAEELIRELSKEKANA